MKVINTDKNQGPALMTTIQYVKWCSDHLQVKILISKFRSAIKRGY
jgi:hypothetical protein